MADEIERLVAEVEVKTTKALAAIKKWKAEVRKELKGLVRDSVELALETDRAAKQAEKFRKEQAARKLQMQVEADTKSAEAEIDATVKKPRKAKVKVAPDVDSFKEEADTAIKDNAPDGVDAPVGADTTKGVLDLTSFRKQLRDIDTTSIDAEADVNTARGLSNVRALRAQLRELMAESINIPVDVDDVQARVALAKNLRTANELDGKLIEMEVRLKGAAAADTSARVLGESFDNLGDQARQGDRGVGQLDRGVNKLAVSFGIAGAASAVFQRSFAKLTGISALTKAQKENRQEVEKNTAATAALTVAMNKLSADMAKAGVAAWGLKSVIGSLVNKIIMASVASTVLAGALGIVGVAASALAVEVVALVAVLSAGLVVAGIGAAAMFGGLALGALAAKLAFKDLDKATDPAAKTLLGLKDQLTADFEQIGKTIRAELAGPLTEVTSIVRERFMPVLQEGLRVISSGLGEVAVTLADQLTQNGFLQDLMNIFMSLKPIMVDTGKVIGNVAKGIVGVFSAAMPVAKEFSGYIVELSDRFRAWIDRIRSDGTLTEFLQTGLMAFRQLGDAVVNWGGGLMQVLRLAAPLGLRLLDTFKGAGQQFMEWTKSAEGISQITGFISSMEPVITSVGGLLKGLAKGIFDIIRSIAPLVAPVIDGLTNDVVPALRDALKLLAPVGIKIIAALTPIIPKLLPVVAALADIADTFVDAFAPVLDQLASGLGEVAPLIAEFAKAATFAGAVVGQLIDPLKNVLMTLLPQLTQMWKELSPPIIELVKQLAPLAGDLLIALGQALIEVVKALIPVIPDLTKVGQEIIPLVTKAVVELTPFLAEMVTKIIDIAVPVLEAVVAFMKWLDSVGLLQPALKILLGLLVVSQIAKFTGALSLMGSVLGSLPVQMATRYMAGYLGGLIVSKLTRFTAAQEALNTALAASPKGIKETFMQRGLSKGAGAAGEAATAAAAAEAGAAAKTAVPAVGKLATQTAAAGTGLAAMGEAAAPAAVATSQVATAGAAASGGIMASVSSVLAAIPVWGWIALAILAVVAAVTALYFKWEPMRDFIDGIWQGLQKLWDGITQVGVAIWHWLVDAFDAAAPVLQKVWDILSTLYIEPVITAFQVLGDLLRGDFSGALDRIGGLLSNMGGALGEVGSIVWDALKGLAGIAYDAMVGMLKGLWSGWAAVLKFFVTLPVRILNGIPSAINWLVDTGTEMIAGMVNGMFDASVAIGQFLLDLPGNLLRLAGSAINWLVDTGTAIIAGLVNGMFAASVAIGQFILDLPGNLLRLATGALDWLVDTGTAIIAGLVNGMFTAAVAIVSFMRSLPSKIMFFAMSAGTWLVNTGQNIINGLLVGAQVAWAAVLDFFQKLPGRVVAFFVNAYNWLTSTGTNILVGLYNGVISGWNSLVDFVKSIPGRIRDFFVGAKDWLIDTGVNMLTGLWNGIVKAGDWFKQKFINLIKAIIPDPLEGLLGIKSPSTVMAQYGVYIMQGLGKGIDSGAPGVATSMRTTLTSLDSVIAGYTPPPVPTPQIPTQQIATELTALGVSANTQAQSISTSVSTTIQSSLSSAAVYAQQAATATGQNIGVGLYNGMAATANSVAVGGFNLGKSTVDNAAIGAQTSSPSRATYVTGLYVAQGLQLGLQQGQGPASAAGAQLGQSTVGAVAGATDANVTAQAGANASAGLADGLWSRYDSIVSFAGAVNDQLASIAFPAGSLGDKWLGLGPKSNKPAFGGVTPPVGNRRGSRTPTAGGGGKPATSKNGWTVYDRNGNPVPVAQWPNQNPDTLPKIPFTNITIGSGTFGIAQPKPAPMAPMPDVPMPSMGPISSGIPAADPSKAAGAAASDAAANTDVLKFFGWLEGMLNNSSTFTMDWTKANQLAAQLTSAGWRIDRTGQNALKMIAPDGRFFTVVGDPSTVPVLNIAPLIRPLFGSSFTTTTTGSVTAGFTAPSVTDTTKLGGFQTLKGDIPSNSLYTASGVQSGFGVPTPALPAPQPGDGGDDMILNVLRDIKTTIATVKQPLIGELNQTISKDQQTDVEIAQAALRASALVGK